MIHDDDYRISFPEKKIYITRNHDWAFAAWELAKLRGELNENATLIHVDGHLDNMPDGTKVEGLLNIKTPEDIYKVTSDSCMKIENFIWAGIATDTLQRVLYVSHQTYCSDDINDTLKFANNEPEWLILNETIKRKDCTALRFRFIEDFKSFVELGILDSGFLDSKSLVLDLDLDYFILNDELLSESQIYQNLKLLKNLFNWDLITVALSPWYCGGEENCRRILDIFFEVFELDIENAKEW
ncbi:UPF0489 family protein [Peribacillus castrilensis]|uniref:UPF0489 family protein n=1 Tax=Peribacillus TaxID=2675229 RepID=UPI0030F5AFDD